MIRTLLHRAALLVAVAVGVSSFVYGSGSPWEVEVVVTGLNNPRHLNVGPGGRLYIAEAGRGGEGPCEDGPEGPRCFGTTGAIARWNPHTGSLAKVATGLPSLATNGTFATGPHDVSLTGIGRAFFTIGYGGDPGNRQLEPGLGQQGRFFAREYRLRPNGDWDLVKDLGNFEAARNPTGDEIDTNPYGILALASKQIIADAGANDLLEVGHDGRTSVLATFPNRMVPAPGPPGSPLISMDAVPTSVVLGPNGDYLVGQLTGFPFPVGGANVYRVPKHGGAPTVYASGFTNIIDIARGDDGSLYVLEIARHGLLAAFGANDWAGRLIRVRPDGTRTELAEGALVAPGGVAIGHDGALYVTNNSIYSGIGEVLRIRRH